MFVMILVLFIFSLFLGIYIYFLFKFKKYISIIEPCSMIRMDCSQAHKDGSGLSERTSALLTISIIVCARNEEKNIKNLLEALVNQDIFADEDNSDSIEIIIANDQSDDDTEKIAKEYSDKYDFIKIYNVEYRDNALSPKKNALKQAIYIAKGEIILLTDADCIPTKNWVRSHRTMYEKYSNTDMIVGFAKTILNKECNEYLTINEYIPPKFNVLQTAEGNYASGQHKCVPTDGAERKIASPTDGAERKLASPTEPPLTKGGKFEHIDFLILMFAAQGAIQSGIPFSCSGQNLSYKRESFYDVHGFDDIDHFISGDDLLLMQKFVKYKKNIKFLAIADVFTETVPINSWNDLFNQRARWASNLKAMTKMNLIFFIYLLSCFVCMGLLPFVLLPLYLIKIYFDDKFIKKALVLWNLDGYVLQKNISFLGFKINMLQLWYIINPFYILTVSALGIFSFFKWKDRRG